MVLPQQAGERSIVLGSSFLEGRTLFGSQRKNLPGHIRELKDLTLQYAKQETLDPLKSLGRFIGFGTAGAFCLGIGFILLALAGLRALQTETGEHFTGHLTWVPYLITLLGCVAVIAISVWAIFGEKRKEQRRHKERQQREATEVVS